MKTRKDLQNELAARVALAKSRVKLAEGDPASDAPAGKFAAVRAAADKASQALADLESNSGDVDAAMGALDAALAAVAAFEDAASAMGASKSEETPEPAPEAMADAPPPAETEKMSAQSREVVRLRAENAAYRAKQAKAEEDAAVVALAAEMKERDESAAKLVGRVMTPAVLAELTSDLPIARVRRAVELSAAVPAAVSLGRIAPVHGAASGDGSKDVITTHGVVTLTANQLRECERTGAKPEAFAAIIATRTASKG